MTRREIAALACKIIAVWLFAQAALIGPGIVILLTMLISSIFSDFVFRWSVLASASPAGLQALSEVIVGLFLWFKAPRIAARMVADDPSPVTRPDISQQTFLAVALSVTGIYVLIPVVRELAADFFRAIADPRPLIDTVGENWHSVNYRASILSSLIGLAFAIWLIFGSRGISNAIIWARSAGQHTQSVPDDGPPSA